VDESGGSEPYEELASSPRTLIGITSQALRGSVPSTIPATNTNPTLATDGTEFNSFIMDRSNQEQLYVSLPPIRPLSLRKSPSTTTDSSTIYSESDESRRSTTSISETSVSSGSGSPSVSDFGGHRSQGKSPNRQATLPTARATTQPGHAPPDPPSHAIRKRVRSGEFHFPRPNDDEVELLFRKIMRSLDLGDTVPKMTTEQKWKKVYNVEHLRWSEEPRQQNKVQGSPQWYIQRIMDGTITREQVSSLEVCLRTNRLRSISSQRSPPFDAEEFFSWFKQFVSMQGIRVLAEALAQISREAELRYSRIPPHFVATLNPVFRRNEDIQLECSIVKCVRTAFNNQVSRRRRCRYILTSRSVSSVRRKHTHTRKSSVKLLHR